MTTNEGTSSGAVVLEKYKTGSWVLNAQASNVSATVRTFWGLLPVKVTFDVATGQGESLGTGSFTGRLSIPVTSLNSKNKKRDTHLLSADFFEATTYPEITFELLTIEAEGQSGLRANGSLTIKGVTRRIDVPVSIISNAPDAATIRGTIEIDRSDFSITGNQAGMIKDVAKVEFALAFTKAA